MTSTGVLDALCLDGFQVMMGFISNLSNNGRRRVFWMLRILMGFKKL